MRKLFVALVAVLGIAAIAPVAVIALSAPKSPPAMISMAAPFRQIRLKNIPAPQHFQVCQFCFITWRTSSVVPAAS